MFMELEDLRNCGYYFEGIHHTIDVVCCCDWKAGACIEGMNLANMFNFLEIYL